MEFKTCEEYVLAELEALRVKNEELEAANRESNEFAQFCLGRILELERFIRERDVELEVKPGVGVDTDDDRSDDTGD